MVEPVQDSQYEFFRRAYQRMDTATLLDLLKSPPIIDSNHAAAIAELSARGVAEDEIMACVEKQAANARRTGDGDQIVDLAESIFDL